MISFFTRCLRWLRPRRDDSRGTKGLEAEPHDGDDGFVLRPEHYPVFPPPPPRNILLDSARYFDVIAAREFAAPQGYMEDSPLFALYRLYEFIVLDRVRDYRNVLEAFWRQQEWAVERIPDPKDGDPERYAFLAGCTYLLTRSFNERVKLGLRRDNPPLITPEEAEAARAVPNHLRSWEKVPAWAEKVAPLKDTLSLPTEDGVKIETEDDPRADLDFLGKNILIWTPHISFT